MTDPETLVLGLDTSTAVVVGLARDGVPVATAVLADRLAHAEQLMPMIRRVCTEAGVAPRALTSIVAGLGPGPFTGLRVGVVSARVLAATLGVPLRGVCSLDVIAAQHVRGGPADGTFLVASDARRREVYWARYDRDGNRTHGPSVDRPAEVPAEPVVGPAADLYPDVLRAVDGPRSLDPEALVTAGPGLLDAGTRPLYLRRPDAAEPGRRKPVLVRPRSAG